MNSNSYYSQEKNLEYVTSIKEVYFDNVEAEIKKIQNLVENYPIITFDTEFPGIVISNNIFNPNAESKESTYSTIKQNVDHLKMIQLGITLSDKYGKHPDGINTWQFNMKFNIKEEKFNQESISLLANSGIKFEVLAERGITVEKLGELLMTSGLILNEDITWITFHGAYDLAYLLKVLTSQFLPENLEEFMEELEFYFKNFYDIKYLVQNELKGYKMSLNKLAYDFNIDRVGNLHQAGSDSQVTSKVYYYVKQNVVNEMDLINSRNKLYSLSEDPDYQTETYSYSLQDGSMNSTQSNSMNSMGSMSTMSNMGSSSNSNIYGMLNSYPYCGSGYQGMENNYMYNSMNNMGNINTNYPPFINMVVNNPAQGLHNCVVSTSNFNSTGSTASGNSNKNIQAQAQKGQSSKKKKAKKEKKKKAQKKEAEAQLEA